MDQGQHEINNTNQNGGDDFGKVASKPLSVPGKTNKRCKIIVIILAVMVAVFAAAVIFGLVGLKTNILYFGFKKPDQKVILRMSVCDDKDIDAYNHPIIAEMPVRDYINKFITLSNDIKNRPNNDQDATCQYILYAIAFLRNDDAMAQYRDNVKKLNLDGIYPNNKIFQLRDTDSM